MSNETMLEIDVSQLSGPALDWAVAKAVGKEVIVRPVFGVMTPDTMGWQPSSDWSQGGPLIERESLAVAADGDDWCAAKCDGMDPGGDLYVSIWYGGGTPLIAACRAIVAAKIGDKVAVPQELIQS